MQPSAHAEFFNQFTIINQIIKLIIILNQYNQPLVQHYQPSSWRKTIRKKYHFIQQIIKLIRSFQTTSHSTNSLIDKSPRPGVALRLGDSQLRPPDAHCGRRHAARPEAERLGAGPGESWVTNRYRWFVAVFSIGKRMTNDV